MSTTDNIQKQINDLIKDKQKLAHYIIIGLCVGLVLLILWYFYRIGTLNSSNCANIEILYNKSLVDGINKMQSLQTQVSNKSVPVNYKSTPTNTALLTASYTNNAIQTLNSYMSAPNQGVYMPLPTDETNLPPICTNWYNFDISFNSGYYKASSSDDPVPILYPIPPAYYLINYYVKSSYNSCCSGNYKNDYVSTCALSAVIKQNVRFLDFEIYSVDNLPVVAASSKVENRHIKETYNTIAFSDVLKMINTLAFSSSITCGTDPLIVHLRLMSTQSCIYNKMAKDIENYININYLLSDLYSYKNCNSSTQHIAYSVPINNLFSKIIFVVDASTPGGCVFGNTNLAEYINIVSTMQTGNTPFKCINSSLSTGEITSQGNISNMSKGTMKTLRYNTVKNTGIPDAETLSYHAQYINLVTLLPAVSADINTISMEFQFGNDLGCQFIAVPMQTNNLGKYYSDLYFNEAKAAFVLKPIDKCRIPLQKPPPPLVPDEIWNMQYDKMFASNINSNTGVYTDNTPDSESQSGSWLETPPEPVLEIANTLQEKNPII